MRLAGESSQRRPEREPRPPNIWAKAPLLKRVKRPGPRPVKSSAPAPAKIQEAFPALMPQRASAASSATRASTHCAPSGVYSFFQNGAWVFR